MIQVPPGAGCGNTEGFQWDDGDENLGKVEANTENSLEVGLRREEINGVVVYRRSWSRGFALLSYMELLAGGGRGCAPGTVPGGQAGPVDEEVGHEDSA